MFFFGQQGILNALGRIPNAISTLFSAPAGRTVPLGDPQFRQEGFFSVSCAFASFSFKLGRFDVSFLKAVGVIILCGLTSYGLMRIVYWAKLMF